jgi:diacylglycerol kinase (ATP)
MNGELRNALLIHNPNAGNGGHGRRRQIEAARRIFSSNGIDTVLAETRGPGEATQMAQRAGTDGRQLVIACGGDGTLNEIINGLAAQPNGLRVPMALLPGGTANVLAKELGLPWDIPRAAQLLVNGQVKEIALGLATPLEEPEKKRFFLSVAGAGPDGIMVYSLDLDLKARIGILAYWWQGMHAMFRYKFPLFKVVSGDQEINSSLVVIGRTKHYGGPFKITTRADLFGNEFEGMAVTTRSGMRYLSYLPKLWFGEMRKTKGVFFWKADRIVCEPLDKHPVYAQIDGEPLARLPVEFKIVPRALKLLVPREPSPGQNNGAS